MERVIVGIGGASGAILAKVLIEYLSILTEIQMHIVTTPHGDAVFAHEIGESLDSFLARQKDEGAKIIRHGSQDMFAPIASGSFGAKSMVVVPCSMCTAGKLASGISDNLLCRAADVMLKERQKLVLVPRESPMHEIHLQNLAKLSGLGAVVAPPVPMFYDKAKTLDEMAAAMVGRILKAMDIPNDLYTVWEGGGKT